MPTINKPGVYIQESLTPTIPTVGNTGPSIAAFIGIADRGPTTGTGSNVVAVPTVVNNLTEFANYFGYGTIAGIFDSSVTNVSANPNTVGTSSNLLKYAVKTFFDNGGTQAVITRIVNKNAVQATANFVDQSGSIAIDTALNTTTIKVNTGDITITASSGTPFVNAQAGAVVSFTGAPTTNSGSYITSGSFVIDSVPDSKTLKLKISRDTAQTVSTMSSGTLTITGGVVSASSSAPVANGVTTTPPVSALVISAKDHGIWGNNLWVAISPSSTQNYFDLTVYYSTRAAMTASGASAANLLDSEIVETFSGLTLNASDTNRYVLNAVSSKWISLTVNGNTASATRLPAFTTVWTGDSIIATTGVFSWDASTDSTTGAVIAARAGVNASTAVCLAGTAGSEGSTAPALSTDVLPKLDSIQSPLVLNYPGATAAATVNDILTYLNTRGDSFGIISPGNATTPADVLSNISKYQLTGANYAAVYFPNLIIQDPASSITTNVISVAPGGSVAAVYTTTDVSRGTFKAPAGVSAVLPYATPAYTLTSAEFDKVMASPRGLNIIRTVPGAGTCIMGARTIYSPTGVDSYISVRRALNYLEYTLKNSTQFAVFEPNDQNLWSKVTGVVSGVLNDYWKSGGLAGETADQAYYVKCDNTNNTDASIAAGQLNIEVGVALQRPAEYVIIKIGQFNGGATVTSSI